MNSPCKLPAFVNIVDIQSLSLSLPILFVEILIYGVFSCACICAVHLPLQMNVNQFYDPVVALGMLFEVSCLGHPKKYLEEMGRLFAFLLWGLFCSLK